MIGHIVDRVILKNQRGHGLGYFITTIIAEVILAVFASIIVAWFSRRREYRADAGGADLAGKEKMIAALQRLQMASGEASLPDQMAAFGISGNGSFMNLFRSHPPLEERIDALRGS